MHSSNHISFFIRFANTAKPTFIVHITFFRSPHENFIFLIGRFVYKYFSAYCVGVHSG